MQIKTNLLILFVFSSIISFAQTYTGARANELVNGSNKVRINSKNGTVEYFEFSSQSLKSQTVNEQFLKSKIGLPEIYQFKIGKQYSDHQKNKHIRYQLFYNNIKVEGLWYTVHYSSGIPVSANGNIVKNTDIPFKPAINESQAIDFAINAMGAKKYRWESDKSLYPSAELILIPVDSVLKLCYKTDIYAIEPLKREFIYIDAISGSVLKRLERIHDVVKTGRANTLYSGTVDIITDSISGIYYLKDTSRGNGINTYNLNNGSIYLSATDFTDDDNIWDSVTDKAAYDAHFGSEMTYDFFYNNFGRNSIDDLGFAINSYVHYGYNYANAFWDGEKMTFGDGNGSNMSALTCLDIVGHEISHGLTTFTADLEYKNESGALNESFSDIFGVAIDFYANPNSANYLLGEQIYNDGSAIRSMENPNSLGYPDTYKGRFYYTGFGDNGGVHYNSSVQNYWFYLLCEGGIGTNDNGDNYSVPEIGMEKASEIAYRNLTVYLNQYSQFSDARYYSIQSAIDLYGECSQEVMAVTNAWYAVGVGDEYSSRVVSSFVAENTYSCSSPATISFKNQSINATGYEWFVNDAVVSTEKDPSITFNEADDYSVKLIVTGSAACGSDPDTTEMENYIHISDVGTPVAADRTPASIYGGLGGIYNVNFAGINNSSSNADEGYMDFTCQSRADVIEGKNYPLEVFTNPNGNESVAIWIDLNNDGGFTNNELLFTSSGTTNHKGNIYIPECSNYNTPLRMRVGSDNNSYFNSLTSMADSYYGQYEDYSVFVQQNTDAPVANFSMSSSVIGINDNITFEDQSINLPTQRSWTFEGGSPATSTESNPTVIFNSVGTYQITLIVESNFGSDTISKSIEVVDEYVMGEQFSSAGLNGKLYDSGGSAGNYSNSERNTFLIAPNCAKEIKITFNYFETESCCDKLAVYDGTDNKGLLIKELKGTLSTPVELIAESGSVYLEFTSDGSVTQKGFEAQWSSTLFGDGNDVVADFIVPGEEIPFNFDFQLFDNSINDPVSWIWDFGDNTNSYDQNPVHKYVNDGVFDIELIVNNCHAEDTIVKQVTIELAPELSVLNDTITFNVISGDTISNYLSVSNLSGGTLVFNGEVLSTYPQNPQVKNITKASENIFGFKSVSQSGNFIYSELPVFNNSEKPEIIDYREESFQISNNIQGVSIGLYVSTDYYQYLNNLIISNGGKSCFVNYSNYESALDTLDVLLIDDIAVISNYNLVRNWIEQGGLLIIQGDEDIITYNTLLEGTGIEYFRQQLNYANAIIEEHDITKDINQYLIGRSALSSLSISNNAIPILYDSYMNPHCAVAKSGLGKIMVISDEAFGSYDYSELGHTELFFNTIKWGTSIGVNGDWLVVNRENVFVNASESDSLKYQINSTGLIEGVYIGDIQLNSNDINNETTLIPIKLNVTGIENIETNIDSIWYSKVFVNKEDSIDFYIKNTGTAQLAVSDISSGLNEFDVKFSPLTIQPKEDVRISVSFRPQTNQIYRDTLVILSSDPDHPVFKLPVSGNAVNPPVFEVVDSVIQNLNSYQSSEIPLTLSNIQGGSSLMIDSIIISNYTSKLGILSDTIQNDLSGHSVSTPYANFTNFNDLIISNGGTVDSYNLDTLNMKDVIWINGDTEYYYSDETLDFIDRWVKKGGGLFVETTYASSNSRLFKLLNKMGVQMSNTGYKTNNYKANDHIVVDRINPNNIFNTSSYCLETESASKIITDINDNVYACAVEYGYGKVIITNFVCFNSITNQDRRLFAMNSVRWLANKNSWLWVSEYPTDSIYAGEEIDLKLNFEASNRPAGQYNAIIYFSTNDPENSSVTVQATLNIIGVANQNFVNDTINFGDVYLGYTLKDSVSIYNSGTSNLIVSTIVSTNDNFAADSSSLIIEPRENKWLGITYTPTAVQNDAGYIIFENNSTKLKDTLVVVGNSFEPPVMSLNPDSIHIKLRPNETSLETVMIDNSLGGSDLRYEISIQYDESDFASQQNELTTVLDSLNANFRQITDLIPIKYSFSEGIFGNNISDGGYDMYDNGNYLNTNIQNSIYYSDNLIVSSLAFGSNGKYFTKKFDGLFVLAADLDHISSFSISGNLGADGYGSADGSVLSVQKNGINYQAFVKRVYGTSYEPSVNQMIIIEHDNKAVHSFSTNTNSDEHIISNLQDVTRLYYLLYASKEGNYIDDENTTAILNSFLSIIHKGSWVIPEQWEGVVNAGTSSGINLNINTENLEVGQYMAIVKFYNNDPVNKVDSTVIDLTVQNNFAPVLVHPIGNKVIYSTYNEEIDLNSVFSDPDNDQLFYSLSSSNNDVVFPALNNGSLLQLYPVSNGFANVTITATDNNWDPISYSFEVMVRSNSVPLLDRQIEDITLNYATPYRVLDLSSYFSDGDGDDLFYTISVSNANIVNCEQDGSLLIVNSLKNGIVIITVKASDGKGGSKSDSFIAKVEEFTTSIFNPNENEDIKLFPNPVQDVLNIHFSNNIEAQFIQVVNLSGEIVFEQSVRFTDKSQINLERLTKGVYFLIISTKEDKIQFKFLKK